MARLEVVELVDRHHVDGAHALDLGAQVGDHLVGRQRARGRRRRGFAPATAGGALVLFALGGFGRVVDGLGLASRPSRSICSTSAATSSSVACTVSDADGGEVRQVGFGGRALRRRAATLPRARPRARGAPRGCATSCSSNSRAQRLRRLVGASGPAPAARRRCGGPSSSCRSEAAIALAQLLAPRGVALQLLGPRATTRASSSRAASSSRCTSMASALLRSTSAACAALASAVTRDWSARGLARLEQLALRRRQLLVGRPLLGLDALDRLARLVLALLLRAQLFLGAAPLDARSDPACATTRSAASPAVVTCRSKPTIAFSCRWSSRLERRDRGLGGGDRDVERRRLLAQAADGRLRPPRRARAAP